MVLISLFGVLLVLPLDFFTESLSFFLRRIIYVCQTSAPFNQCGYLSYRISFTTTNRPQGTITHENPAKTGDGRVQCLSFVVLKCIIDVQTDIL